MMASNLNKPDLLAQANQRAALIACEITESAHNLEALETGTSEVRKVFDSLFSLKEIVDRRIKELVG